MVYNPKIHNRRSLRLKGYDYSQIGLYFVTICAHDKKCLFGEVAKGEMQINEYGKTIESTWNDLVNHNGGLRLKAFVVMPNHVHGIVEIGGAGLEPRAGLEPAPTGGMKSQGLQEIVRQFKTFSAKRINAIRNLPGTPVWQRNYYEHVIRDEDDCTRIIEYITTNPQRWAEDSLHPDNAASPGAGSKPVQY